MRPEPAGPVEVGQYVGSSLLQCAAQGDDLGVPRHAFAAAAAAAAPLVRLDHPTGKHSTLGFEALPNGFEAELVESAERGQVRASEGSVRHVEVFQVGSARTPILGRPRPLSGHRRAPEPTNSLYTLIWEEPVFICSRSGA